MPARLSESPAGGSDLEARAVVVPGVAAGGRVDGSDTFPALLFLASPWYSLSVSDEGYPSKISSSSEPQGGGLRFPPWLRTCRDAGTGAGREARARTRAEPLVRVLSAHSWARLKD